jgi:hypothetical protein
MSYSSDADYSDYSGDDTYSLNTESEEDAQPKTPPPKLKVDQWNTAVMLEIYKRDRLKDTKWFQNLEMAWVYVYNQIDMSSDSWVLNTIETVTNHLKKRWDDGLEGLTLAVYDKYKYKVFYQPEENEAIQEYYRQKQPRAI